MKNSNNTSIGFFGLLGIVFITLKLTNHIDWSWWWVTAPLWGGFAFFAVVIGGLWILVFIIKYFQRRKRAKRFGLR